MIKKSLVSLLCHGMTCLFGKLKVETGFKLYQKVVVEGCKMASSSKSDGKEAIPLETVKQHNKPNDLWVAIEGKVYDLTKFRNEHPGGEEVLNEVAGKDASKDFNDVGHTDDAKKLMKKYYLGQLA